jgi:hypothetical protein
MYFQIGAKNLMQLSEPQSFREGRKYTPIGGSVKSDDTLHDYTFDEIVSTDAIVMAKEKIEDLDAKWKETLIKFEVLHVSTEKLINKCDDALVASNEALGRSAEILSRQFTGQFKGGDPV